MLALLASLFILVANAAWTIDTATGKTRGFFPMEGGWPVGVYVEPMVELALTHVNANATLLPNFILSMTWNNTKCAASPALAAAVWQFTTLPDLVGVIGEGCSIASEPIALLGGVYKMPQISFGSTSPLLSDGVRYPYFLRVCSSDTNQGLAWLAAAKHFGWKRVGTLNSQENLHALLTEKFLIGAQAAGIEVVVSESFPGSQGHDVSLQLNNIAKKGVTIIFMACYSDDAARVLEEIEKIETLNSDRVVFIGTDAWVIPSFVELSQGRAMGYVGFSPAPADSAFRTQIIQEYEAKTGLDGVEASLAYADYGYDAVTTFALGLHQLLEVEKFDYTNRPIEEFRLELYNYMLNSTFFQGMTKGTVTFDPYGDRSTPYGLYNYQASGFVQVAEWDPVTDVWIDTVPIVWPDNTSTVPPDRFPITYVYIGNGVKTAFIVIAAICAVVPVVFAIGLGVYWDHPRMVAATPVFMMCILFGTLMGISVVWVIAVDPTDATCVIPIWLGHIAFWIVFSCLFVKTFRVWWIFNAVQSKMEHAIVTNLQIFGVASLIVLAVSVYLAIWTGLGRPKAVSVPDPIYPEIIRIKKCDYDNTWNIVIYAVELAFLACGCILAYKINKVKILKRNMLRFNESSHIAVCIFCLIFVGLVIVPSIEWLSESNDTKFILECVGLLVNAMVINLVLFVPKFYAIFTKKSSDTSASQNTRTPGSSKGGSKHVSAVSSTS